VDESKVFTLMKNPQRKTTAPMYGENPSRSRSMHSTPGKKGAHALEGMGMKRERWYRRGSLVVWEKGLVVDDAFSYKLRSWGSGRQRRQRVTNSRSTLLRAGGLFLLLVTRWIRDRGCQPCARLLVRFAIDLLGSIVGAVSGKRP